MSKKTTKRKINARRKKANHGTKPNAGRGCFSSLVRLRLTRVR